MSTLMLRAEQNVFSLYKNKLLIETRAELKESLRLETHKLLSTFSINDLVNNDHPMSYQINQSGRSFHFNIRPWQTFQTNVLSRLHTTIKILAKAQQELPLIQYCSLIYCDIHDQDSVIELASHGIVCNN